MRWRVHVLLASGVLLAACGGGGETTSSTTHGTPSTRAESSTTSPIPVTDPIDTSTSLPSAPDAPTGATASTPSERATEVSAPTLSRGATGEWVSLLQEALAARGFVIEVDGIFGPATEAAVRALQETAGIDVDGIVGPVTWAALTGEGPINATAILRPGGVGTVAFGAAPDEAVAGLSAMLGPPDVDEAIEPLAPGEEDCVEGASWEHCLRANGVLDQGRIVRWSNRGLSAAFTDATGSAGALTPTPLQFSSWQAVRPAGGEALTTPEGIGPGSTVGELRAAYTDHRWLFNEGVWDGVLFMIAEAEDCDRCVERGIVGHLDYGSEPNGYVRAVQRALDAQGADLAVDGEIGPSTEGAWEQFCADHNLSCSAEWPTFPWFITDDQRAALEFPPSDVVISAMES